MDAVAAVAAPLIPELTAETLSGFLGSTRLRVVHAHRGRPFGVLLKGILHGRLGASLRCGRLDLRALPDDAATRGRLQPWVELAGIRGEFPPPPGYYLFHDKALVGYHPEPPEEADPLKDAMLAGARGLKVLVTARDPRQAGRQALRGRPELDILRFFETARGAAGPQRAPAAPDRRTGGDRRRAPRDGTHRRATQRLQAELEHAFRLLGVSSEMSLDAIKKARNRLMRSHHPDRLHHDPARQREATRLAVQINHAWSVVREAKESAGRRAG